jgi:hypothetical protein
VKLAITDSVYLVTITADELRRLSQPGLPPALRLMLCYDVVRDGSPDDQALLAVQLEDEEPGTDPIVEPPRAAAGGHPANSAPRPIAGVQPWLVVQDHAWVDQEGRRREIETMPLADVQEAIAHCRAHATYICTLVSDAGLDRQAITIDNWMKRTISAALEDAFREASEQLLDIDEEAERWLSRMPLLLALERRRATILRRKRNNK